MSPASASIELDALEPVPSVKMRDLARRSAMPSRWHSEYVPPVFHRARDDAADRQAPDVFVVVEVVGLELQRRFGVDFGPRQMADDRLEQRLRGFRRARRVW